MRWILTHPQGVGRALRQPHSLKQCLTVIGQTPEVNRETRLSIYGNGYFWRLIEGLGSTFSSVNNVLGDDFYQLARAYLIKHPSMVKSIDDIGNHMGDFLKTYRPTRRWAFLPELATMEWAAHQAFFADDVPLLDPKVLSKMAPAAWPRAIIELDRSVRLLKIQWPVDEIWRDDGEWDRKKLSKVKKIPDTYLLISRFPDKLVRVPRITSTQYQLLTQFQKGKTLAQALSKIKATSQTPQELTSLQNWFASWTRTGVIRKIRVRSR